MTNSTQQFGISQEQLDHELATCYNANMYVAGLLSDAQHMVEIGKGEQAIQYMNRVKYFIFEHTDTRSCIQARLTETV
jgi:hypothetical protein